MTQMSLILAPERHEAPADKERATIEERYAEFTAANPHVFTEALRLARQCLDHGEKYLSVKAIYETLRTTIGTEHSGYRLNNDFTALLSRDLIAAEPRLEGVIRLRRRK